MSKRSAKYRELLNKIYGQTVVNAFVKSSSDETLEKFAPAELNTFIETRNTETGSKWQENEGCQKCSNLCNDFSKRKMDFPGWLGELDFSKENTKKIMLIGEDVGPSVKTYINIAYSLGLDRIEEAGTVIKIRADGTERTDSDNLLWKRLKKIFPADIDGMNGLEWVTENIYITDICKCGATELANNQQRSNTTLTQKQQQANAKKVRDIFWGKCSKEYLIDEIKLVRPKVIIFQGNTSYNYARKLFAGEMIEYTVASEDRINNNFPKYGQIQIDGININFLKIYHSSSQNNGRWSPENIKKFQGLVPEKIIAG